LKIEILHQRYSKSSPMGEDLNYAKEFKSLDLAAVKKDLVALPSLNLIYAAKLHLLEERK
jgi:catalase (peroxidase I)